MNLNEFTARLSTRTGLSRKMSRLVIDEITEIIKDCASSEENVNIKGLGRFIVKHRNPRLGMNPQSGERLEIPATKVLTFKPSPSIKEAVRTGSSETTTLPEVTA